MATILFFGDSNTHGTVPLTRVGAFARFDVRTRWTGRVAGALPAHEVIAEGLPGRTTVHDDVIEGGTRNGALVLPALLPSHAPIDLLVIMLGTNDLKPAYNAGPFQIARSLERLVRMAQSEGCVAKILLVAPVPVRETGVLAHMFAGAEARQEGLARAIEEAAARSGCAFMEAGAFAQVSDVDGVHWDAEAHAQFAEAMIAQVQTCLAD